MSAFVSTVLRNYIVRFSIHASCIGSKEGFTTAIDNESLSFKISFK